MNKRLIFVGVAGLHVRSFQARYQFMSDSPISTETTISPLGEISQAPPALEVFLDKHQSKLIVVAVILALAAVAYVIIDGVRKSGEETAGAILSEASDAGDLQSLVKNHEGTAAAESAKLLLAEKQWKDGQQDDAISTLKGFLEKENTHPSLPTAKASLATKYLAQGKVDEASAIFQALADEATFLAPYALISLGDIKAKSGDIDAATKSYEAIKTDFAESPFASDAAKRLLLMKAKPPVEIEEPVPAVSKEEVKKEEALAQPESKPTQ
jgi:predicted negative regulator of RcsB-dependent stress response